MHLKKNKTHVVTEDMIKRIASARHGHESGESCLRHGARQSYGGQGEETSGRRHLDEAYELTRNGAKKDWGYEYLERVARHTSRPRVLCYLGGNTPSYLTIVARGGHGGYMEHSAKDRGRSRRRRN
jgi:hypothetical protein